MLVSICSGGTFIRLTRLEAHSLKTAHCPAHLDTAGGWRSLLQNARFSQLYGLSVACCQNPWDKVSLQGEKAIQKRYKKSENCSVSILLQQGYCKTTVCYEMDLQFLWRKPIQNFNYAGQGEPDFHVLTRLIFQSCILEYNTMQLSPSLFLIRSLVHIKFTRLPQTSVAFVNWPGSERAPPWNLLLATKGLIATW